MYTGAPGHRAKQALVHHIASPQGDHAQTDSYQRNTGGLTCKVQNGTHTLKGNGACPIDPQANIGKQAFHSTGHVCDVEYVVIEGKTHVRVLFEVLSSEPIAGVTSHDDGNMSESQTRTNTRWDFVTKNRDIRDKLMDYLDSGLWCNYEVVRLSLSRSSETASCPS